MSANFTPNQNDYKNLTPFKEWLMLQINTWGQNNFPFVESDFDELTNYGMMQKLMKAVNDVINNENMVEQDVTNLFGAFTELQSYVNNYFDNLSVQDEVNIKLDEMAQDGTLTFLIKDYMDPFITAQNTEINNFKTNVNSQLEIQNNKIEAVESGSPLVASSTSEMTDTTRVYVNTTDGKWYYYDGDSWEIGGTYQATQISENDPVIYSLRTDLDSMVEIDQSINLFNKEEVQNGYYDKVNNNIQVNSSQYYKCYLLPVEEETYYTLTGVSFYIFFTGDSTEVIDEIPIASGSINDNYTFQTPAGAKYATISFQQSRYPVNDMMMVKGQTLPDEYVPYYRHYYLADRIKVKQNNIVPFPQIITNLANFSAFKNFDVLGDSLSVGTQNVAPSTEGRSSRYAWGYYLEKMTGVTAFLDGISGGTTRSIVQQKLNSSINGKECYIIGLGVNDSDPNSTSGGVTLGTIADVNYTTHTFGDTFYGNYAHIIDYITTNNPNAHIFCLTNPCLTSVNTETYNNAIINLINYTNSNKVHLINLYELYGDVFEFLTADREDFHYHKQTYYYMGSIIGTAISNYMLQNPEPFRYIGLVS